MSTAAKVELYVSKHPYVKEALAGGIVNYSALARKIENEENVESTDAVKVALSRYEKAISEKRKERRKKVSEILKSTELKVQGNVNVVKSKVEDSIVHAKTENGYTSITAGGEKGLISLESSLTLEETPGVLEFILSSIASRGINVEHLISCREDTHLVVDSGKTPEVLEILQQRTG